MKTIKVVIRLKSFGSVSERGATLQINGSAHVFMNNLPLRAPAAAAAGSYLEEK
jgi:hypothetical protein